MYLQAVVVLVLFFQLASAAEIRCPINEEFNACDSACPPTCQDRSPQVCTDQCVARCACKPGFIRQAPGAPCVPSCEGIPVCGENEVYSNCSTLCPPTCQQSSPIACPAICLTGCVCKEGYIREKENGQCIPQALCPRKCGENEFFTRCGSPCPATCTEPIEKCVRKCTIGCFCKKGFVLDREGGKCIKQTNCSSSEELN